MHDEIVKFQFFWLMTFISGNSRFHSRCAHSFPAAVFHLWDTFCSKNQESIWNQTLYLRSLSFCKWWLRNVELLVYTESHILCPLSVQLEANIWLSGSVRELPSSFHGQFLCHCSDVVCLKAAAPPNVPDAHVVRLAGVFGRVPTGHVSGLHGWNGLQCKSLREDLLSCVYKDSHTTIEFSKKEIHYSAELSRSKLLTTSERGDV